MRPTRRGPRSWCRFLVADSGRHPQEITPVRGETEGLMAPGTIARHHFAVVTDSTADMTRAIADRNGVNVVPLNVTIGDETYQDGVLTQAEFFERMRSAPTLPMTSQPSVGALAEAYGRALKTADSVIALHVSSRLSGVVETAHAAAKQFDGRVHVFDSRNLSWGLGWQVLEAAAAAREGLEVADALARLEEARERVKIIVSLDSLENLRRGGRIGAVASRLGSLLNIKVTIVVDPSGAFVPVGRSRGDEAALAGMLEWISSQLGGAGSGRFAVGHAMSAEKADRLAAAIKERWQATELVMYEAGTVISAHAGTIWGVAFYPGG
jgi:DegV family protein with EDD domain